MEQYIYRTEFRLEAPVNDINAARKFLEDNSELLLKLLRDDIGAKFLEAADSKFVSITWNLVDEDSGYIEVVTTEELWDQALDAISQWIRGHCADGVGETFEQMDFANYNTLGDSWMFDDEEEEMEYEASWVMASFDWRTNKYKLRLFKVK